MQNAPADVLAAVTQALKETGVVQYKLPAIQDLTWADLQKMDGTQLKEIRKHPEGAAKIDQIIAERLAARGVKVEDAVAEQARLEAEAAAEATAGTVLADPTPAAPTPEEIAAAEAAAQEAEAARVADETEAARVAAEAAVKKLQDEEAAKAAAAPKRFVYDFQARDEDGNPIGNKTHLEASSQEELDRKKEESYQQAVRAIARLKKQKPTFKAPDPVQIPQAELDAAAKDITSEDPAVRAAAVRKLASAETEKDRAAARLEQENARQAKESYAFLKTHVADYNNCEANNTMLAQFLLDNNLEWTASNLEIALGNLEGQLAPVIVRPAATPVSAPPAANPAPAAPPAASATAAPAAAPAATVAPAAPAPAATAPVVTAPPAPAAPAPAANPAPAPAPAPMKRPGVNAGIVPGQTLSGAAPVAKTAAQTRAELVKELKNMSADEMKRRHKLDPKFYEKVNAILASK
jgi:hypothetical protein